MPDIAQLKAQLILAAYTGAVAVCEPLINEPGAPTPIPIDPLIQDTGLQAKGTLVYEEAKVQYAALLRAFEDETGIWPDPAPTSQQTKASGSAATTVTPAPTTAAQLVSQVQALFKGLPPTISSPAAQQLVGLLGALVPQTTPTNTTNTASPTIPSP
jgi:hypothetical protein